MRHSTPNGSDQPVSTGTNRYTIGNLLHMADESGKCLVNAMKSGATAGTYLAKCADTGSPTTYSKIISFGPFPLTLNPDGKHYPILIRICGSSDKAGDTVSLKAVVCAPGHGEVWINSTGASNVATSTAVADPPTWLTTDVTLIQMTTPDQIAPCSTQLSVIDVSGGYDNSVTVCAAVIEVWGATVTGTSEVFLHGLYAQEVIGA